MTTRGREVIRGKLWIPKGRSGKVCRVSYWFCCVDVVLLCETLQPLMCAASERTFANMFSRKESIRLSAILSFSSPRCMNFFDFLAFLSLYLFVLCASFLCTCAIAEFLRDGVNSTSDDPGWVIAQHGRSDRWRSRFRATTRAIECRCLVYVRGVSMLCVDPP